MRALASLAIGLVVFLGVAVAIVPGDARGIVLPAAVVAAVILLLLVVVKLKQPDDVLSDTTEDA